MNKIRITSQGQTYDLTLPVTISDVPAPPPVDPAVFSISANPQSITLGQSSTITCSFENVAGAWLRVGTTQTALAGPVSRTQVMPATSTTYTLRVLLRDGNYADKSTVVQVAPAPNVPPQPTGAPWLGVNVITHAPSALDAAAKGCRAFLIMDNEDTCRQIKQSYPDAVVVARRWTSNWQLNGQQLADRIGGADDGVIYELLNEADNWSYGTVEQIRQRINVELEACAILRAKGVRICMGGYSMGTPRMEDPAIAAQVRRYTEFYNNDAGVFFSMHLYSPNMNHVPDIWYERRYEWLFTHCGFDPRLRKILSTEDGLDEGGIGGYPAHKATSADFERITTAQQNAHMQPVVVNGVSYPSPLIARMLYCATQYQDPKWSAGFEVTPWLGWVQARGWK